MAYAKKESAIACTRVIPELIKQNEYKKAYLLYGEERYLVNQNKENLMKFLNPQGDTMNVNVYSGKGINVREVIDLAETLPFFAERRVIVLEECGLFSSEGEELADYLPEAPDTTIFLFVEQGADGRSKLYKSIKKTGVVVNYEHQTDETLEIWVKSRIRQTGKQMPKSVISYFVEKIGNNMQLLELELEKLICYVWDKQEISVADVNEICITTIEDRIFQMIESISKKDQKATLRDYHDLLAKKEPAIKILTMINKEFLNLVQMKELFNQRKSTKQVAEAIGINEYFVKRRVDILNKYTKEQLMACLEKGVETDHSFKAGKITEQLAVELFMIELTTQEK